MIKGKVAQQFFDFLKTQNVPLTLEEIAEYTGLKRDTLRTQINHWYQYPEFKHILYSKRGRGYEYWYSLNGDPGLEPKEKKSRVVKEKEIFCKVLFQDGDDIILVDDQLNIIKGRYMK